jgi:hypothetical protein
MRIGIITHPPFTASERNVSSLVPVDVRSVVFVVTICKKARMFMSVLVLGEDIKKTFECQSILFRIMNNVTELSTEEIINGIPAILI